MADNALWQMSASDLATGISAGEISARDAAEANISRMNARNPAMNAIVQDLSESAMEDAARLDEIFAKSGPVGPLHGVPITIKDNIDQAGISNPNGVPAFAGVMATEDNPFVTNLKNAGAVIIGRTNTPEFSFRGTTDNPLYGRTFNPWNDWASAGGSSGGASSAVMSGMGAIAHGNDIGGSLRFPATCTGAATVKPGLGRTPAHNTSAPVERGLFAQLTSVQGVICREVRDVRLAMQTCIGYSPLDTWQVPMPWNGPAIEGPIKVGFTKETYGLEMHPAVEQALDTAREALTDAGYEVVEIEVPNVWDIGREATRTLFGEVNQLMMEAIAEHGSAEFKDYFQHCFDIAPPYEGKDLILAFGRRTKYLRDWNVLLDQYPLIVTPFLLQPTYAHARDYEGREGAEDIMLRGFYSFAMNFMGLPAGNVSANYNDGLPIGVQIVGQRFREDLILDACEAVEARVGVMAQKLFERG